MYAPAPAPAHAHMQKLPLASPTNTNTHHLVKSRNPRPHPPTSSPTPTPTPLTPPTPSPLASPVALPHSHCAAAHHPSCLNSLAAALNRPLAANRAYQEFFYPPPIRQPLSASAVAHIAPPGSVSTPPQAQNVQLGKVNVSAPPCPANGPCTMPNPSRAYATQTCSLHHNIDWPLSPAPKSPSTALTPSSPSAQSPASLPTPSCLASTSSGPRSTTQTSRPRPFTSSPTQAMSASSRSSTTTLRRLPLPHFHAILAYFYTPLHVHC